MGNGAFHGHLMVNCMVINNDFMVGFMDEFHADLFGNGQFGGDFHGDDW